MAKMKTYEAIVEFKADESGQCFGWNEIGLIVRCKDCKWWGDLDPKTDWFYCYCHVLECSTEPDWFCADGERKDDETD